MATNIFELKVNQGTYIGVVIGIFSYVTASKVQKIGLNRRPWHLLASVASLSVICTVVDNVKNSFAKDAKREKNLFLQRQREHIACFVFFFLFFSPSNSFSLYIVATTKQE